MAKSKATLMAEGRARLLQEGLVPVTVHIPAASRARLENYVRKYLSGKVPPVRKPKR